MGERAPPSSPWRRAAGPTRSTRCCQGSRDTRPSEPGSICCKKVQRKVKLPISSLWDNSGRRVSTQDGVFSHSTRQDPPCPQAAACKEPGLDTPPWDNQCQRCRTLFEVPKVLKMDSPGRKPPAWVKTPSKTPWDSTRHPRCHVGTIELSPGPLKGALLQASRATKGNHRLPLRSLYSWGVNSMAWRNSSALARDAVGMGTR